MGSDVTACGDTGDRRGAPAACERAEYSCTTLHRRWWIRRGAYDHGWKLRRPDRGGGGGGM